MMQDSVGKIHKLGFYCLELGDYSGGLDAFARANGLCPNAHEMLHFIGVALAGHRLHQQALERIEAAVRLFPQVSDALADLGDCFAKLGRCGDRKVVCGEALESLLPGEELRTRVEPIFGWPSLDQSSE